MTKLSQIIDAATGDTVSTASLLRMVKVVAARLDTAPLADWVDRELGGYADEDDLPRYRGPFEGQVMGVLVGPFNSTLTVALPKVAFPERLREGHPWKLYFMQSVSELEALGEAKENLQNPWAADMVSLVNYMLDQGEMSLVDMHRLQRAYKAVTPQQIRGVVDAVRTRVLNLALDLERIAPQAGEPDSPPVDPTTVSYVVTNNIYGDGNATAISSPGAIQGTSVVKKGDLDGLLRTAASIGVPQDDVTELREAIEGDTEDAEGDGALDKPGRRVTEFLGKVALGAAGGTVGGTLTALIRAFFGF
jgi:hypothetical protein